MTALKDVQGKGNLISLSKLTGKKVVDIVGFTDKPYGDVLFQVSRIILEDGTQIFMGGEHDCPYLETNSKKLNLDPKTLESLYAEENARDGDDEDDDNV